MQAKKKIPLRKCLGCASQLPKKELVRIVRTPDGQIVLDTTGKLAGRGAYICPKRTCLAKAVKGKRVENSLEVPVSPELYEALALKLEADE